MYPRRLSTGKARCRDSGVRSNWPAMVTILDGRDRAAGRVSSVSNRDLSSSWVRGVRSGQINQLNGFCRE